MAWARNLTISPRFIHSTPDPMAHQKALGSATRLLNQMMNQLKGALTEDDVCAALDFRSLARITGDVLALEKKISQALEANDPRFARGDQSR